MRARGKVRQEIIRDQAIAVAIAIAIYMFLFGALFAAGTFIATGFGSTAVGALLAALVPMPIGISFLICRNVYRDVVDTTESSYPTITTFWVTTAATTIISGTAVAALIAGTLWHWTGW